MAASTTVAMLGTDTFYINGQLISNQWADGTVVELTFPNELVTVKTGKNGNAVYAFNATGTQCEVKIRIVRGGSFDQFLNGLLNQQNISFATFPLMTAAFIKNVSDGTGGAGSIIKDTYSLTGGVFHKGLETISNLEGDTQQAVVVYLLRFSKVVRLLS